MEDLLRLGWSPQTYGEIFLPLVSEAVQLTHEFDALYIYQDDGKQRDIIPFMVANPLAEHRSCNPTRRRGPIGGRAVKDVFVALWHCWRN